MSHVIEECGEVVAAAGKLQGWGRHSVNPLLPVEKQESNIDWLRRELDDLENAISRFKEELGEEPATKFDHADDALELAKAQTPDPEQPDWFNKLSEEQQNQVCERIKQKTPVSKGEALNLFDLGDMNLKSSCGMVEYRFSKERVRAVRKALAGKSWNDCLADLCKRGIISDKEEHLLQEN